MTATNRNTRFTRNKTEDVSSLLYGKIPPQNRELEEAVLGAILIEKDAISYVSNILMPESFYVDAHSTIFRSIQSLLGKSQPIDLLTVTEDLRKSAKLEEVGGAYYLSELTNKVASSANVEYHARIIIQKFIQRELIRICNGIIHDSYEDTIDVFDLLDNTDIALSKIKTQISASSIKTVLDVINNIKKDIINPPPVPLYVPTTLGIKYNYGTVNAIGAKPGTGKTAFMIQSAVESIKRGIIVGILSLELKERLLTPKIIHYHKGTFASKIIENNLTEQETEYLLSDSFEIFDRIKITDKKVNNLNIRSVIVEMVLKYSSKIIWIDYIQLVTLIKDKNTTEVKAMEDLMNLLQEVAKELDIAIVILSQMKRGYEKPTVEELRGGGVEQACSRVYLLYDEFAKENDGKGFLEVEEFNRGKLTIIDGKSRFDDKNTMIIYYDKLKQIMMDWNDKTNESTLSNYEEQKPNDKQKFDLF